MVAVEVYSDLAAVDRLRDGWHRLWSLSPRATFAQTYEWFAAAAGAAEASPRVFAVNVSGRLVGLWPLFAGPGQRPFSRSRVLRCAGFGSAAACLVGPSPSAVAAAVARRLARSGGWGSLLFRDDCSDWPAASAFAAAGLVPRAEVAPSRAEVLLKGRWSDVLDACDEEARLAFYRMRHYADDSPYRFERFRPAAGRITREIREALDATRSLPASEESDLERTFGAAAARGTADLALLRRHGQVVATAFNFVTASGLENRLTAVAAGAPESAGTRLLSELFRDSAARGDQRFVFSATPGHPANGWAKASARRFTIRVDAPGSAAARLRRIGRGFGIGQPALAASRLC